MKKLLSIITLVAIILTSLSVISFTASASVGNTAYGDFTSRDNKWIYVKPVKYNKNEIAIIQYKGNESEVTVPEKIDGMTVTGIGDFYVDKPGTSGYELVSKLFPNSSAVTSVHLPKTVRDIGDFVYEEYEINDYNYAEGSFFATVYDYEVLFKYNDNKICPSTSNRSIKEFLIDSDNPYLTSQDGIVYNKDKTKLILFPAGKQLDTFTLPQGVTDLREFAFANTQVKKVENFKNLKTLPTALFIFSDIEKLPDIEKVSEIPSYAFAYCSKLKTIDIPLRVDVVFDHAFYYCKNAKEIDFGKIIHIGTAAFAQCSSLEQAIFSKTCRMIEDYAFSNCTSLKAVILPHAELIGSYAFNNCTKLSLINTSIGFLEVNSPYNELSAQKIERHAFKGCKALKYLWISDSKKIEKEAFIDCIGLAEVHFWFDIPDEIQSDAFKNTALVNKHKGGVIYIDSLALCYKKPSKAPTSIWIKKGTTHIASSCLYKLDGVKALYLPSTLKVVEQLNIYGKDLKRVYISGKNTKFDEISCQREYASGKKTKYYVKSNAYSVLSHLNNDRYSYTTNWNPDKTKSIKAVGKSKSTAKITWKKQGYVTGYKVYMKTSKNGKWKKIATLKGSNSTSYTKKGLSKNKTYYFRVRAYKTVENTTYHGAYSSSDAAKTKKR